MSTPILNYKIFSAREELSQATIYIIHGLLGRWQNWRSIAQKLNAKYDIVCLDLCNHGASYHAPDISYPKLATDLERLMQHVQNTGLVKKSVILGHSMGGKVCMAHSLMYPRASQGQIIVDIQPVPYPEISFKELIQTMLDVDLSVFTTRQEIDQLLSSKIENPIIRQFLLTSNLNTSTAPPSWNANLAVLLAEQEELVTWDTIRFAASRAEIATLLLSGERSSYTSVKGFEELRRYFPNSREIVFTNAGHWLHSEQSSKFISSVDKFLSETV